MAYKQPWDDYGFSNETFDTGMGYTGGAKSTGTYTPRCYMSHPPLPLGNGLVVYGGSCSTPVVKDADVYVGLDQGMKLGPASYPWEPGDEVLYAITDCQPPSDSASFKKLIEWLAAQITAGRKCHVGCIGGHGRTGMVLSALAKVMLDEKDAIEYVRTKYCKKVVETSGQVAFLVKQFGIKHTEPAKGATWSPSSGKVTVLAPSSGSVIRSSGNKQGKGNKDVLRALETRTFTAIRTPYCMFGADALPSKQ